MAETTVEPKIVDPATLRRPCNDPGTSQAEQHADAGIATTNELITAKEPPAAGQELEKAVAEAKLNLLCATRQGIEIPEKELKLIIGVTEKGAPDSWGQEDLVTFWSSARVLAKRVADVSPVPGHQLTTAISEAEQIFLYTARHGIDVPDELLKTIMGASKRGPADQWSEEDQAKIWRAAQALAKLVHPVTINSIKTTQGSQIGTVGVYGILSIVVLLLLIVFQVHYVRGVSVTSNIEMTAKEKAAAISQMFTTTLQLPPTPDLAALPSVSANAPAMTAGPRDQSQTPEAAQKRISELRALVKNAEDRIVDADKQLKANNVLLDRWLRDIPIGYAATSRSSWLWRTVFMSSDDIQHEDEVIKLEAVAAPDIQLASAKATLKWMLAYLLPLLYGLLGTCAYVMRSISKEISDVTFSNTSHLRFILRLALGALSGIGVGLILTSDTLPPTLVAVTPIGLAFLAGYSVELLFSAMDHFISAFSSNGARSPGK